MNREERKQRIRQEIVFGGMDAKANGARISEMLRRHWKKNREEELEEKQKRINDAKKISTLSP